MVEWIKEENGKDRKENVASVEGWGRGEMGSSSSCPGALLSVKPAAGLPRLLPPSLPSLAQVLKNSLDHRRVLSTKPRKVIPLSGSQDMLEKC